MSQWAALVQYYFKVDPDTLDDEKLAVYIGRLMFALKKTNQYNE